LIVDDREPTNLEIAFDLMVATGGKVASAKGSRIGGFYA
jgi:hypothetical protein